MGFRRTLQATVDLPGAIHDRRRASLFGSIERRLKPRVSKEYRIPSEMKRSSMSLKHFPTRHQRPWTTIVLVLAVCACRTSATAQETSEFFDFNPHLKNGKAAANWKMLDLSKVGGVPLVGDNCYGINAADLDVDGDVDLVVTFQRGIKRIPNSNEQFGVVYWLENVTPRDKATPAFRARLIDDQQRSPKVAIIGPNAGERPSIVVPSYLAGETILYQSTAEMNWTKVRLRSKDLKEPVRAVVADIDGNGSDDIVVTSIAQAGHHLTWFRASLKSRANWKPIPIGKGLPSLIGVDSGDVDADGDLDLVAASPQSPDPWLLLNVDGRGTRWKRRSLRTRSADSVRRWVAQFSERPVSQNHVRLADVDGDGDLDCLETSLECGYAAWRENSGGANRWKFRPIAGKLHDAYRFDIGDLNRDGLPDMVVPADGAGGVFVFRNRNQATRWTVTQLDKRRAGLHWPNIIQLADVNQDGHLDILATDWAHKAVAWIYRPPRSVR